MTNISSRTGGKRFHHVFQHFMDRLNESHDPQSFQQAMAEVALAFDLPCFAYLRMPHEGAPAVALISNYPIGWTDRYLEQHYEKLDPVIRIAHERTEPFEWGFGLDRFALSPVQAQLFDEAAQFGIRCGFTVPIQSKETSIAAVTFASDLRQPAFQHTIRRNRRVLQLMAISLHCHVRRKLYPAVGVQGLRLSPRERECLRWAAEGKSRWESGQILGLSPRTVKFHLDNAKAKLGVRTIAQAVCCFERVAMLEAQIGSAINPRPTGQGP